MKRKDGRKQKKIEKEKENKKKDEENNKAKKENKEGSMIHCKHHTRDNCRYSFLGKKPHKMRKNIYFTT